jgi:serine/threonine-protein kinase
LYFRFRSARGHKLKSTPVISQVKQGRIKPGVTISKTPTLLEPGTVLNKRYRIIQLLGQGGFGTVYRAWDLTRQFFREATLLANLAHSNLPRVTDHFIMRAQGEFLVMDFVEGEDLQAKIDRSGGPLPETLVLPWFKEVCDALLYLHNQQPPIIHRDIKPANIRITSAGKAMLVDFGIAKIYDPQTKTTMGARAVTPGYSPLEQYGHGATDTRSDIYSLGATLFAALTGQDPPESVQLITNKALLSPRSLNPHISVRLEKTILKAMELRPEDRFQSVTEFYHALS